MGCGLVASSFVSLSAQDAESPLDRLKNRSAEARWEQMKDHLRRPRQRPAQAAPRSANNSAPPASRVADPAEPQSIAPAPNAQPLPNVEGVPNNEPIVTAPASPFGGEAVWRSAEQGSNTRVSARPAPADRSTDLNPAPDSLTTSAQTDLPRAAQVPADDPARVPLPPSEQSVAANPAEIPEVVESVDTATLGKPAPVEIAPELTAIPMTESISPEEVFRPEADGNPLLVPNPDAFQQSAPEPYVAAPVEEPMPAAVAPNPEQFMPPGPDEIPVRTALADVPPAPDNGAGFVAVQTTDEELLTFRPITKIEPFHDYSPSGTKIAGAASETRTRAPEIQPLPATGTLDREFAATEFQWEPSNVYHNPLYFEDPSLERYGHVYPYGLQPAVSVARFGAQIIGLPYQMALDPAWRSHYPLGYYRPGDPAPSLRYQVPFNARAATTAAGVYTGLIFIFP